MIEGLLNIRNLLTLKDRPDDASLLKSGTVVKARVIDVNDDGSALLRLLLSGGKNMQGTLIRARSEIALVKGQNLFLEIFSGKDVMTMRLIGDTGGSSQSAPATVTSGILDTLVQMLSLRQSGNEVSRLLDVLKSVPGDMKNAIPEFKDLERVLTVLKQLDPAVASALAENSDIPFETLLAGVLKDSDLETLFQGLRSLQPGGDLKTMLKTLSQLLKDPGLVDSLRQSGLSGTDLKKMIDVLLRNLNGNHEVKAELPPAFDELAVQMQQNIPLRFLEMLSRLSDSRLSNSEFKLFLNLIRSLPAGLKASLPDLKGLQTMWDTRQLDGKMIKAFVEKSGVAFETKLTIAVMKDPGQILQSLLALQSEGDLKSLLLQLKKILGERDVSSALKQAGYKGTELSHAVERILDNIEFHQLTSKLNDMLYTFLPIAWEGLNDGELMFRKNRGGKDNSYTCDINLDLESLGRISVSITIRDRQFLVSFYTDREETEELMRTHKHILEQRFAAQGLPLKALNLCRKRDMPFGQSQLKGVNVKI